MNGIDATTPGQKALTAVRDGSNGRRRAGICRLGFMTLMCLLPSSLAMGDDVRTPPGVRAGWRMAERHEAPDSLQYLPAEFPALAIPGQGAPEMLPPLPGGIPLDALRSSQPSALPSFLPPMHELTADISSRSGLAEPERSVEDWPEEAPLWYGTGRPHLSDLWVGEYVCHRPLYFEEVNLERYGRSAGPLQPAVSVARFFVTIPALPYMMAADPPRQCTARFYPYPAGRPAPRVPERLPFSPRGGLVIAGVATGLAFLVP